MTDIFVNFNSAFVDDEGKCVTNRKIIAKKYLKSWFAIDFIACVPISNFYGTNSYSTPSSGFQRLARVLRLLRLYRLIRVPRLFKVFK